MRTQCIAFRNLIACYLQLNDKLLKVTMQLVEFKSVLTQLSSLYVITFIVFEIWLKCTSAKSTTSIYGELKYNVISVETYMSCI